MFTTLLLFVLGFTGFCKASLPLPSYIEPCALSNPKFKECVLEEARKTISHIMLTGDKKYRVPVLEPLEVTEIRIDQGASQVGLSLTITDAKIYGLKDMKVEEASFDFKKNQMLTELQVPTLMIVGKYNASGKILLLPIVGNGDINITLYDAIIKNIVDFKKITKKDGLDYIEVQNPNATLDVSLMHCDIDNLFNGDKTLGEQTNIIINENWKEVFHDLEPAVKEALSTLSVTILKAFMGLVPLIDIFPK